MEAWVRGSRGAWVRVSMGEGEQRSAGERFIVRAGFYTCPVALESTLFLRP